MLLLLSHFSLVSDSVWPHRRQPNRLPRPWDFLGKNTGVGCHFLLQCMKVKSESEVTQLYPTLVTSWTAAYQAPPSMGFSRWEYWSGVPLPSLHLLANNIYLYPKMNIWGASWLLAEMCRIVKIQFTLHTGSQLRSNKVTLLSCCSSHNVNKYLFHSVFRTMFCSFLCFLFVILLYLSKYLYLSKVLKCCLGFPSARKLWYVLWRKSMY